MGGKASDPNKAAMRAQRDQMARLDAIDIPELQEYVLQSPELVGLLEAEGIDPSKMEEISTDPRLKADMMSALEGIRERSQTGLTEQDKFAMEELMGQVGAQEKAQRSAIEQEMQRRGTADSGTALAAKLQGSTAGSNSARQQAMQMAAQGQQQRMSALQNLGQMSSNMQSQDFSQQAQVASAQDAIARANAMNRQGVAGQNLAARQAIENQRAGIANQQSQVKNQIAQQNFANQMSKATGQGAVSANMSQIAANAPQKPGALQAGLAGAATGAAIGGPWGAAAGAGVGLLSSFEDGGIARSSQDEDKAHEKFKKEYMKRVREELSPQKKAREEVTGTSVRKYADGGTVDDPTMEGLIHDFSDRKGFLGIGSNDLDTNLKKGNAVGLGVNTDQTSVNTNQEAQQLIEQKKQTNPNESALLQQKKGMFDDINGDKLSKGLKAASALLGGREQSPARDLKLSYQGPQVQNLMQPMGAMQFDNPMSRYQSPQFQDGGVAPSERELSFIRDFLNTELDSGRKLSYDDARSSLDRESIFKDRREDVNKANNQRVESGDYDTSLLKGPSRSRYLDPNMGLGSDMMSKETPYSVTDKNKFLDLEEVLQQRLGYKDGGLYKGTKYAEDGSLMFDSTGDSAIVGGDSFAEDRVDARLNSGEAVLNVAQQQRLMDLLRGEADLTDLGDGDIVEGVPRSYQEKLKDKVDNGKDLKMEGLRKLLKALGEE